MYDPSRVGQGTPLSTAVVPLPQGKSRQRTACHAVPTRVITITTRDWYKMKKITLLVDEEWLEAINNLTQDVYDGETCTWLSIEEVAE